MCRIENTCMQGFPNTTVVNSVAVWGHVLPTLVKSSNISHPVSILNKPGNYKLIKIIDLQVIWKLLLRKDSSQDVVQLKNLINRTNVPPVPESDMNACEDFLNVILTGHILAAAIDGCLANDLLRR